MPRRRCAHQGQTGGPALAHSIARDEVLPCPRDDLAIGIDGRSLTIEAPLKLGEADALTSVYAEVRANHFRRSFELSSDLDTAKIEKDLSSPEVKATIEENFKLAEEMGLNGTPSYVIGKQIVVGAVGLDGLKEKIGIARCGKATC